MSDPRVTLEGDALAEGPAAGQGPARPRTRQVSRRSIDRPRVVAFEAVRAVDDRDAYANLVLPGLLRRANLRGRDAAFATELTYGALRGRGTYDAVLARCSTRPLADMDAAVLDVLRLGAHQILAMRVPAHAALSATVDLARSEIGVGAAGFVNAVLRRVSERDTGAWLEQIAPEASQAGDPDGFLAARTSHPAWIVRAMRDSLRAAGRDSSELPLLLDADNARPLVTLVALPGLSTVDELRGPDGSVDPADPADPVVESDGARRLSPLAVSWRGGPPESLDAVRTGRARVQDAGSQVVALALTQAPLIGADRGRWLDLCAGPGGKAALLAAVLSDRVRSGELDPAEDAGLLAVDSGGRRAELVREALSSVVGKWRVQQGDGRAVGHDHPDTFDRVLVDAPCTGLGALRRRPEARWRRAPSDVATLAPVQRALLAAAIDATRPGGVVAYATCSPHVAETRMVVDDVLARRDDVERLDARRCVVAVAGDGVTGAALTSEGLDLGEGPHVQLWPHVHGTDGMFVALLRRRSS